MLKTSVCFSKMKKFKQNEAGIQVPLSFSFWAGFQEVVEDLCHFPQPLYLNSAKRLAFSPVTFSEN